MEEVKDSSVIGSAGGLSQEELDALCVTSDDDDTVDGSPSPPAGAKGAVELVRPDSTESFGCLACFAGLAGSQSQRKKTEHVINEQSKSLTKSFDDLLLQTKRTRFFVGSHAADALILNAISQDKDPIEDTTPVEDKRLTQAQLDALGVDAEEEFYPSEVSEELLLSVRRTRHFLGDDAADAIILDAMTKTREAYGLDKESSEDLVSTASGSLSPPLGLSQGELDAFCVSADEESQQAFSTEHPGLTCPGELLFRSRRMRHFVGHEKADAFLEDALAKSPDAPIQQKTEAASGLSQEQLDAMAVCADDTEDSASPGGSATFLFRTRRARHFIGEEVAHALAAVATNHGLDVMSGLPQDELDSLAVRAGVPDEPCAPEDSSEAFLLRVRRARHFMGSEVADAMVEAMSKSPKALQKESFSRRTTCVENGSDDGKESFSRQITRVDSPDDGVASFSSISSKSDTACKKSSPRCLTQAELDDMGVNSEEVAEAVASVSQCKVRSKLQGLCIETELADTVDITARLKEVASPLRNQARWKSNPPSPTKGSSLDACGLIRSSPPSSPQRSRV